MTRFVILVFVVLIWSRGCWVAYAADLPTPSLTPGAIDPHVTVDLICDPSHSTKERRHTTQAMKNEAFHKYGLVRGKGSGKVYEVDHLVPLVLGGADDEANLWPQAWAGEWGARVKDRLEVFMWRQLCAGDVTLEQAQECFLSDWIKCYRQYVGDRKLKGWQGDVE